MMTNLHDTQKQTRIAIDATNIRGGGGLTHLLNLIKNADPSRDCFDSITIWASPEVERALPKYDWLQIRKSWWCSLPVLRFFGVQFLLPKEVEDSEYDVLLSPGGTIPLLSKVPTVTMCQNMLPFQKSEAALFGRFSPMYLKLRVLYLVQKLAFKNANGTIFLTNYAKNVVSEHLKLESSATSIIPHGIEDRFFKPNDSTGVETKSDFELVYVSIFLPYKHQFELVKAVLELNDQGIDTRLSLVGRYDGKYGEKVLNLIQEHEKGSELISLKGELPFEDVEQVYNQADASIFASSCENLPNILLEAMASGLPLACSDKGPMPEVLEGSGCYFDPYSVDSIKSAILKLQSQVKSSDRQTTDYQSMARKYSWLSCASNTLSFCRAIAGKRT